MTNDEHDVLDYSYLYEQKLRHKLFPLKKNAIGCAGASMSCALAFTLHTNYWSQRTFI